MQVTLLAMFQELNSFVECNEYFARAKASKITTKNNTNFASLVDDWGSGVYDESPELLVDEMSRLLPS
jgi:hypothetical protein